jgi:uncharacterized membrane protein YidH (DUF202 family)
MEQAQNSWNDYKEKVSKIGQERSYHTNLMIISIILIIVNAFILSAFWTLYEKVELKLSNIC